MPPTARHVGAIMPAVKTIGRRRSRHIVTSASALCSVMGLVLVWSRLANLGTSFWSDEAYSAYYYAGRGPRGIFFGTYVPNNHALYNLLSWVTTGALGRFEASYRIWSVVPGARRGRAGGLVGLEADRADRRDRARGAGHRLARPPRAHAAGARLRPRDARGVVMLVGAVRASDHELDPRHRAVRGRRARRDLDAAGVRARRDRAGRWCCSANQALRKRTLIACRRIAGATLAFYAPMLERDPAQRRPAVRQPARGVGVRDRRLPRPRGADDLQRDAVRRRTSLLNEVATFS